MTRALVFASLGLLAALGQLLSLWAGKDLLKNVLKPLPVLFLVACLMPPRGAYAGWVLVALILCAAGDIFIEGKGQRWFLAGLTAFLLGHLAYLTAFLGASREPRVVLALPVALYGALVLAFLWRKLGPMRIPVLVYVAVISAMLWRAAAFALSAGPGNPAAYAALAGAALFTLSDTLLSYHLFVRPGRGTVFAVNALYWLGQGALAYSAWSQVVSG